MRNRGVRTLILALGLNLILAGPEPPAGPAPDQVQAIIDEVLGVLAHPAPASPLPRPRRLQLLQEVLDRRLDRQGIAQQCLGPTWATLNPAQRAEFTRLLGEILKASYADKLDRLAQSRAPGRAQVTLEQVLLEGDRAAVRAVILRPNDRMPVDFRCLRGPQGWLISDLALDGVSLVDHYRAQFRRMIQESSYGKLVQTLKARLRELSLESSGPS